MRPFMQMLAVTSTPPSFFSTDTRNADPKKQDTSCTTHCPRPRPKALKILIIGTVFDVETFGLSVAALRSSLFLVKSTLGRAGKDGF